MGLRNPDAMEKDAVTSFKKNLEAAEDDLGRQATDLSGTAASACFLCKNVATRGFSLEESLGALSGLVGDSRVRKLRAVWTLDSGPTCPLRLQTIALFLRVRQLLRPESCSFQDPNGSSEAEAAYLNSIGVATPPFGDFLEEKLEDDKEDGLVVYFMVQCNLFFVNTFIARNWRESFWNRVILIHDQPRTLSVAYRHLIQTRKLSVFKNVHLVHLPFAWPWNQRAITAVRLNVDKLPSESYRNNDARWNIIPYCMRGSFKGLVEPTTFDQITANIREIQSHFEADGFQQKFVQNLNNLLEGRRIKRIRIVGTGYIAETFDLTYNRGVHQLTLALNIRNEFQVEQVTFQEPHSTQFEIDYLKSIGVEVLPATECEEREEGLGDNEVALIACPGLPLNLIDNLLWANRGQMRKILLLGYALPPRLLPDVFGRSLESRQRDLQALKESIAKFKAISAFARNSRIFEITTAVLESDSGILYPLFEHAVMSYNEENLESVHVSTPSSTDLGI